MKKRNGYTMVDLLIVIVVFGVITFITISKVSYALSDDQKQVYDLEVKYIETGAKAYGQTKIEEIKQKSTTVTVNHLLNENFIQADDDSGNIYDPRDKSETLNDKKVKLTYDKKKNEVKAEFQD